MARRKQAVKVARRELVFEMWNRISPQEWESLSRETYEQLAKRDGITVPFYAAVAVSSKLREVLAFAFEASLLVGQAQETAVSKRLASWLAIIAVPTAVAGIYGMNFKYIPETQLEYGYFIVMGLMLLTCAGLYWRFRRVGWL
jgi:Mg2+ and Co2+ transporter CorA